MDCFIVAVSLTFKLNRNVKVMGITGKMQIATLTTYLRPF